VEVTVITDRDEDVELPGREVHSGLPYLAFSCSAIVGALFKWTLP
jgi:hypothetical protein